MVSDNQTTGRTCNDYSGINTLSLLVVITKVRVECIIEPAQLRVCHILMEQPKKKLEVGRIILPYQ